MFGNAHDVLSLAIQVPLLKDADTQIQCSEI